MTIQRPKANPVGDTFVHYLFATPKNEHILLSFVNAVQENAGLPPVTKTEVLNPFNPQTFITDKRSIIDIKARTEKNHTFIIEFQVANQKAFANRALYYWAKTYGSQLGESEQYEKLTPVVMIALSCFPLFRELEKLHNTFWLTAQDDPKYIFTDQLQIHTLELTDRKLPQLPTIKEPLRQWLNLFYHSDKKSEAEMKVLLTGCDPVVDDAYNAYLRFNHNEEMRRVEDARQQYLHDYHSELSYAKQEGIAEGEVKAILRILTRRFHSVPKSLQTRLSAVTDLERLEELSDFAFDCKSINEFSKLVK